MLPTNGKTYISLLSVSFLWGTSFAAMKYAALSFGVFETSLIRIFGAALLFAVFICRQYKHNFPSIHKTDYPDFIVLALFGLTLFYPIQIYGNNHTTTLHSSLIMSSSPLLCAVFSFYYGMGRLRRLGITGMLLAFSGVLIVLTQRSGSSGQGASLYGDMFIVLNCFFWALFTLRGQRLMHTYSPMIAIAYIHIIGALLFIPLIMIYYTFLPLDIQVTSPHFSTSIIALLYLTLLCSFYGYYTWYAGIKVLGSVKTSVFMYTNPLFAGIAAVWLLHEDVSVYLLIGTTMILSGIYLTNRSKLGIKS